MLQVFHHMETNSVLSVFLIIFRQRFFTGNHKHHDCQSRPCRPATGTAEKSALPETMNRCNPMIFKALFEEQLAAYITAWIQVGNDGADQPYPGYIDAKSITIGTAAA